MILFYRQRSLHILLAAILLLNLFDLWATIRLIGLYGLNVELNPLLQKLFSVSPSLAVSFKLLTLFLFLFLIPIGARINFLLAYRGCQLALVCLVPITILHLINLFFSI